MNPLRIGLIVLGAAVVLAASTFSLVLAPAGGSKGEVVTFVVEEGSTFRRVASDLEEEGLIRSSRVFGVWARVKGQDRTIRSGEYELHRGVSAAATLEALVSGSILTRAVTLPEGLTRTQTLEALTRGLELDAAELDSLTRRPAPELRARLGLEEGVTLEGYLFPETYRFAKGVSGRSVVETLVRTFEAAVDDSMLTRAGELGLSLHEVVTLASIVEAEAVLDHERPEIAAVYTNRIRKGWKLEADPTVAYALDKIGDRLTYRDLEVDSPYNTYRNAGLPPGPINSPGRASLRATLWPDPDSEAMYFVADGDGGHRFSRTWEEHQAAVRQYRAIQRERRGGRSGGG
jgi:UPF0755 protein